MWPFSTIRKLRARVDHLQSLADHWRAAAEQLLVDNRKLDEQLTAIRTQLVGWADEARKLQAKYEAAAKNDARDPKTGRFKKATDNG